MRAREQVEDGSAAEGFNSLFEMPPREPPGGGFGVHKAARFNSLFEMHLAKLVYQQADHLILFQFSV